MEVSHVVMTANLNGSAPSELEEEEIKRRPYHTTWTAPLSGSGLKAKVMQDTYISLRRI
jgi:hypothetical protein